MQEIVKRIGRANNIALFTHILPDGDAIGSILAMAMCLEKLGKKVFVFINEKVPLRLEFLVDISGKAVEFKGLDMNFDLSIALDCGDEKRLGVYAEQFKNAKETLNIDHHVSNGEYADYNYVEPKACSTGEIIFKVINALGVSWDKSMAELVYAAIASDTGCFVFSNTNENAHNFSAELLSFGADTARINKLLFNTNDFESLKVRAFAINHIEFFIDKKVASVVITKADLDKLEAADEDAEGISDLPRSIRGIEVGMVIREWKGKTKVSLRTNEFIDASLVASKFGGGGHVRAAGCVTELDVYETRDKLIEIMEDMF